jgi:hypothetical protein
VQQVRGFDAFAEPAADVRPDPALG